MGGMRFDIFELHEYFVGRLTRDSLPGQRAQNDVRSLRHACPPRSHPEQAVFAPRRIQRKLRARGMFSRSEVFNASRALGKESIRSSFY